MTKRYVFFLIGSIFFVGCGDSGVDAKDDAGDTDTESATDGDTDTDTDVDTDVDTDADTDTDTDTDTDADTDTDTDTDSDTATKDGDAGMGDGGDASIGDVDPDTDGDVDTDTDNDTTGDAGPDADDGVDSETDIVECESGDTGVDCGEYKHCVEGTCTFCGDETSCGATCSPCDNETPVCETDDPDGDDAAETSRCVCTSDSCEGTAYCDDDGGCAACVDDDHCGEDCEECSGDTPRCVAVEEGVGVCQCTVDDETGADSCNADGDTGLRCDTSTGQCTECIADDACGLGCAPCVEDKTFCEGDSAFDARCVECIANEDCRPAGASLHPSPLGVCSPDNSCTCWVEDAQMNCGAQEDCPSQEYACALEFGTHFLCLRQCDADTDGPIDGMRCEERATDGGTTTVWVPMTTCFALDRYLSGATCERNGDCSVDGDGRLDDGACVESICTYTCLDVDDERDENMCPDDACNANNYCELPTTD